MCLCQIRHAANQNNSIHAHRTSFSSHTVARPSPYHAILYSKIHLEKTFSLQCSSVAALRSGRFNFNLFILYMFDSCCSVVGRTKQYGLPNETKKAIIGLPHRSSATVYRQRAHTSPPSAAKSRTTATAHASHTHTHKHE